MLPKVGQAASAAVLVLALVAPGQARTLEHHAPLFLGMGDSIGEGVQSADASRITQRNSYLNFLAGQIGVPFSLPLIKTGPFGMVRSRLHPFLSAANLAVSGADIQSLLNEQADAIDEKDIDSEIDLVLFPRLGSQMEIAESGGAPFIVCWIGNNDVLSAVISFDQLDASQMTSVEDFASNFAELVQRLNALGAAVVFANIPDVTQIGFLVDGDDLLKFLGSDLGLPEGDFTSIVVMLLIKLGLDDGSLLEDPNFVLDATEVELIQQRIEIFNQIIAAATWIDMPVADINTLFDHIAADPPIFFGVPLTPRFLGGFFSLDGVHPSNIGHALLSNGFIDTINAHFHTHIPPISAKALETLFLKDPFVDKDGDGKVLGRFGAGLLETLGPILGISGDLDEWIPNPVTAGVDKSLGKQFIKRYLTLRGEDPRRASEWDREDVIEAFRHLFGLKIFERPSRRRARLGVIPESPGDASRQVAPH